MAKLSKRMKEIRSIVDRTREYEVTEGFETLIKCAKAKFVESVDVAIQLGIDPTKSDQNVRGAAVLPHGTGRTVRVAVFTQGQLAEDAKAAGADFVGMDELAAEVKRGMMDFDVVIASPDAMRVVGQLGQILGPRGLMPNPKSGTVTNEIGNAVKEVKQGKIDFKVDKSGIVHTSIGKISFTPDQIRDNAKEFISTLIKLRPTAAKGAYIKSIYLSSTMSAGIKIDPKSVDEN